MQNIKHLAVSNSVIAVFYNFFTFILHVTIIEQTFSWKLQLCLNGSVFETDSESCKYGFWFTEPVVVHKICFEHGVWAIYKEFCEDDPIIWTVRPGTKGCMRHDELGKRIIGAVPLGQDELSGAIVSTPNRRLFFNNHKLKRGMRISFVDSPGHVEVLTWGPPQVKFSLHQFINKDRGILQQCLIKGQHSFFAYYRVHLESSKNASFFLAKNVCFTPLSSQTGEGGRRVQLLPSEIDFDILQSGSDEDSEINNMNCAQYSKIDDLFEKDLDDISGFLAKEDDGKLLSRSSIHTVEKRVDEETQKIGLKLMAIHFRNDTFDSEFDTWEFLSVGKQIFLTACPEEMVPQFFVQQIYLLFQALLHESFLQFPNHDDRDKMTTQRILNALQKCNGNATGLKFKSGKNCTNEAPLLKKSFPNGTRFHLLVDMPSFIKVDGVNYDLLMESIWKLMNFAHYYCADYFQELASDHSVLEEHWYRLFSPLVIRRWKYPGRGYLSFQKIFMSIDLERSVRNLDFCVSAARLHSSYKGWLKRPLSHWSKDKQIGNLLNGRSSSRRGEEDLNNSPFLMWNDQAYCMKDYMDPAFNLPYANSIEKCGIRTPKTPLHPFQRVFFNRRGNIVL